jgi:AraC-like DNA-binding protein
MAPLISRETMRFLTQRPAMPLAQFVEYLWFYDGVTPAHSLERVLPEGAFELLINLHEEPRHIFHEENLTCAATFRGSWIAGMHLKPVVIDTAPDSSMMGVHFRPGGAALVLGLPASELSDRVVELDAIWGSDSRSLRDQLLEAIGPGAKFERLEKFLLQRAPKRLTESSSLAHAIRIFESAAESVSIRKVAAEIGWSHKHLISTFQSRVGMSPKEFSRVRRFQNSVRALQPSRFSTLAEIALSSGYYDQSHFNTEFKAFSGLTPIEFLRDAEGRANFIPLRTG